MLRRLIQLLTVIPSFIIGIGGSGIKVVDALKGRMSPSGTTTDNPMVEVLGVDVVSDHQHLEKSEFLQLQVRGLAHAIQRFPWAAHLKNYPIIQSLPNLEEGCCGIPILGKLALLVNQQRVMHALRHKAREVAKRAAHQLAGQGGAAVQQQLAIPIWVIASLFGSTGSGMLFDLAAMIRNLGLPVKINLILFLPDCFSHLSEEDYQRGKAIGYAMLRQLQFLLQGGAYPIMNEAGVVVPMHGLFNRVYLISGISERGVVLNGETNDPFQMAADFLFNYVFTDFGTQLDAQLLNNQVAHPGFSSFGLHEVIHLPHDLAHLEKLQNCLNAIESALLIPQDGSNGNGKSHTDITQLIDSTQFKEVSLS